MSGKSISQIRSFIVLQIIAGCMLFLERPITFAQNSVSNEDSTTFDDSYYDSLLIAYLAYDSLLLTELESDSLSFIDLLSQLVAMDYSVSSLSLRLGYNSHILNAGRDFGFQL